MSRMRVKEILRLAYRHPMVRCLRTVLRHMEKYLEFSRSVVFHSWQDPIVPVFYSTLAMLQVSQQFAKYFPFIVSIFILLFYLWVLKFHFCFFSRLSSLFPLSWCYENKVCVWTAMFCQEVHLSSWCPILRRRLLAERDFRLYVAIGQRHLPLMDRLPSVEMST